MFILCMRNDVKMNCFLAMNLDIRHVCIQPPTPTYAALGFFLLSCVRREDNKFPFQVSRMLQDEIHFNFFVALSFSFKL